MESKKINQLATNVAPQTSDLTIIGDPITGVSKKITLLQIANLFATTGTVSSVAVTETGNALTITGSPITTAGTINIGFAGAATQYVRGDGALADFPTSTGGGSSVSYYLNSSVSQGTIGGNAYRQLSKDPISGAGTDITISANGYIASYITDANDPALLEVPGGNFNCEFYFSVNSNAHNPYVYAELYKYDGTTFTLIGSSQSVPEYLTNGTTLSPYYFAIPVAQTVLTITDRIAIRIYVNVDGRTVTLHTENNHLCQVVTTFSKGLTSLNNLTRQVQFLATGTSGTDFAISSSTATHTFNLPVASATNTGKLSSTDWSTFNGKQAALSFTAPLINTSNTISIPVATASVDGYLDNADWTIFNNKQNAITLTTTGTSGAATLVGATLNIPQYTDQFVGTVTSVAALTIGTSGTDLSSSVANSTTTPVITLNVPTASATNRGALSSTDWTTFNNKLSTATAASTYVPYTGATTNVNLGVYSLTANQLIAGGAGVNNAGTFTTYDGGVATLLVGSTGNLKFFPFWNPSIGARINAENSAGSAYIPLSFYATAINLNAPTTLTGALSGTSATFTNTSTFRATGNAYTNGSIILQSSTGATSTYLTNSGGIFYLSNNGSTDHLQIASTGAATFSSSVTAANNITVTASANTIAPQFVMSQTGGNTYSAIGINRADGTGIAAGLGSALVLRSGDATDSPIQFATANNVRMTITSDGNVGIGTSSPSQRLSVSAASTGYVFLSENSRNVSGDLNTLINLGNNANNTSSYFVVCSMASGDKMYVYGNGNIVNTNNSYGTLSDATLKENIIDATPKLADILQLKVRNFNLIGDDTKQIGFIAQEFEEVFPSMVDIDGKSGKKLIKTSVLVPMLVKAIQEQQIQIDELKALIAAK